MLRDITTFAGTILSVYGLQGHLVFVPAGQITVQDPFPDVLFIKHGGMLVPYFVEEVLDEYRIKLEDINDPDAAAGLKGREVYMHKKAVVEKENTPVGLAPEDLTDFELFNRSHFVGRVLKVEIFPQQIMLFVQHKNLECMIPLAADWVIGIDENQKTITMILPEGLIPEN